MATLYDSVTAYDDVLNTYNGSTTGTSTVYRAVRGIHGLTTSTGTEKLIVVWFNHPRVYTSGVWVNSGVLLSSNNECYFENFLDGAFMVNGSDSNYYYNGTTWSTTTNLGDAPIAQFVKEHLTRLYLYKVTIGGTSYASRVWFSDYPKYGTITWGLETGTNLTQTASSAVVTSIGSYFVTNNIKVGDPFTITTGDNAGEYVVQSVDSESQITLTKTLASNASNSTFWVGGNFIDISRDDGDVAMGIGETSNEMFFLKKNSVHRYSVLEKELRKVKNVPGTTSSRSIVSFGDYVYWYHPSGLYRSAGNSGQVISNAIEDIIEGVPDTTAVVGWADTSNSLVKFFLGNVTTRDGDTIQNCVAVYDEENKICYVEKLNTHIKCATEWLESNSLKIYAADNNSAVYQLGTGTDYNGSAISTEVEFKPVFPKGTETSLNFTRLRAYVNNGPDVQIFFKLYYKPTRKNNNWIIDKDWKPLIGNQGADRSEWFFPKDSIACGVKLKVVESSSVESFLWEKAVIYFTVVGNR